MRISYVICLRYCNLYTSDSYHGKCPKCQDSLLTGYLVRGTGAHGGFPSSHLSDFRVSDVSIQHFTFIIVALETRLPPKPLPSILYWLQWFSLIIKH